MRDCAGQAQFPLCFILRFDISMRKSTFLILLDTATRNNTFDNWKLDGMGHVDTSMLSIYIFIHRSSST